MAFEQALVVIDLQRDYFPGGKFPLPDIERAAKQAANLIDLFRRNRLPVVHVRHLEKDPSVGFLMEGTPGSEIDDRVRPEGQDLLITKHWPNAFRDTTLSKILHVLGSHRLVLCGAMTNMCIDATVRAAFDAGYVCTVVSDACAASDLEFEGSTIPAAVVHGAFLAALASAYGEVVTVDTLAARLAPA
jgi:nicotinamidase-related amidase